MHTAATLQVPQIRDALLDCNWKQIASKAVSGPLDPGRLAAANKERVEGMLAALDFLAERHDLTVPHGGDKTCTEPQPHPPVNASVYMKQANGAMIASQLLELSVDTSKPPAPVTLKVRSFPMKPQTAPAAMATTRPNPFALQNTPGEVPLTCAA